MFRWYKDSDMCIAYLSDLEPEDRYSDDAMFECRWWRRGWTLQELIAPASLRFYDSSWQDNDSKSDWADLISERVGIPPRALHGDLSPDVASVAQKFSWAAHRETTRLEDEAYCLLGLFDVNMPLLYDEGSKAFRRLQEEILRSGDDLTIFAHSPMERSGRLFAESAICFKGLGDVRPYHSNSMAEFTLTNRGLHIKRGVELSYASVLEKNDDGTNDTYFALLGHRAKSDVRVGVCLTKVASQLCCRDATRILIGFGSRIIQLRGDRWQLNDSYILLYSDHGIVDEYESAIYLSSQSFIEDYKETIDTGTSPAESAKLVLHDVVPRGMYYHAEQTILKREADLYPVDGNVVALRSTVTLAGEDVEEAALSRATVVVLVELINFEPAALIFAAAQHRGLENFLFAEENLETSITWQFLRLIYPAVEEFGNPIHMDLGCGKEAKVSAIFTKAPPPDAEPPCIGACTLEVEVHLTRSEEGNTTSEEMSISFQFTRRLCQ